MWASMGLERRGGIFGTVSQSFFGYVTNKGHAEKAAPQDGGDRVGFLKVFISLNLSMAPKR